MKGILKFCFFVTAVTLAGLFYGLLCGLLPARRHEVELSFSEPYTGDDETQTRQEATA